MGGRDLTAIHGDPTYERIDAPATREEKAVLGSMSLDQVPPGELAGEPITAVLTQAPGNGAPIGGLKVATESAWFAARLGMRLGGRLSTINVVDVSQDG